MDDATVPIDCLRFKQQVEGCQQSEGAYMRQRACEGKEQKKDTSTDEESRLSRTII